MITWRADVERNTAGYRVMRRRIQTCTGVLQEEARGFDARGHRAERAAGAWVKVGEVPAAGLGPCPGGRRYSLLDRPAAGHWEYAVIELESGGGTGARTLALRRAGQ